MRIIVNPGHNLNGIIASMIDLKRAKLWADGTPCDHSSCIEHEYSHYNGNDCTCNTERHEEYCSCNTTCGCNSDDDSCIEHEYSHYNDNDCTCNTERHEEYCSCNTTCGCNSDDD